MADDKLASGRGWREIKPVAVPGDGPMGGPVGVRTICRNCGRDVMSPPIGGVRAFCCVICWEEYPKGYLAQLNKETLADLCDMVGRAPKKYTRAAYETLALEILTTSDETVININRPNTMPWHVLTRKGADAIRYIADRVEAEGPTPPPKFEAERVFSLGGMTMDRPQLVTEVTDDAAGATAAAILVEAEIVEPTEPVAEAPEAPKGPSAAKIDRPPRGWRKSVKST